MKLGGKGKVALVLVVSPLGWGFHPLTGPDLRWRRTRRVRPQSTMTEKTTREEDFMVAKGTIVYDPLAAEELFWRQPGRWLWRNAQIFFPLAGFVAKVASDIINKEEEVRRRQRAKELTAALCEMSPAIIKAGQALASRPDLLPAEYLVELQKLQDRVPPFPTNLALQRVEKSLQIRFEDVYELLEDDPVAAASIGQVYRARLIGQEDDAGAVVALKVQRPNCEAAIALDLYILRWWAKFATTALMTIFGRDIDLVSVIDDFGTIIYREIDYIAEAKNAKRFAASYGDFVSRGLVRVPKIYDHLTTSDVLTMEWIEGTRLVDGEALVNMTGDADAPARLVDTLVQCSLKQMLDLGYFHADPHAGNLLATDDGKLCYLDFGMMSYLDEAQRLSIVEAVVHLVNRDFDALADLYVRMGFIRQGVDVRPIVEGLGKALPDVLDASVKELNVKNVVNKLGDVMYTFPFTLPPFYVAIIRCLGVLEGVAIQVDPDFRIVSDAYPYIAARLLTDDAPELRAALRRLLFKGDQPQWQRFEALLERASGSDDYDAARVVDVLVDLVAVDSAEVARARLIDDVVDALDALGADAARDLIQSATGIQLPPPPPLNARGFLQNAVFPVVGGRHDAEPHVFDPQPPATKTLLKAASAIQDRSTAALASIDTATAAVDNLRTYVPLAQRVTNDPTLRRMGAEIIAALTERAASRAIRLALLPLSSSS